MVQIDIKRLVKHLKLSVQVNEKFLGSITYGTSEGKYDYCNWKWFVLFSKNNWLRRPLSIMNWL